MIDLTRTEEHMLAEIRADASGETQLNLLGQTPDELLPTLVETFSKRYESLPSDCVFKELSYLVKKGLGNAYKWGNECAPERSLSVRAVMTDIGAVVAISDQGNGFDVSNVLARFLRNDGYSRHGGSGFFHFHEASSVVSYADGGRTFLIEFLCSTAARAATSEAAHPAPALRPVHKHIDFTQLAKGSQVKIKGGLKADGRFVAEKIALKTVEQWGVIDGVIRGVARPERRLSLLNAIVSLPESAEILSPEQRRLDFDALGVGQAVEVIGSYSPEHGLVPLKVQIRHGSAPQFEEIQGTIDSVSETDATFRVLGITVATDANTQLKDKRA